MCYSKIFALVKMWMSIFFCNPTMCRPTRMTDPNITISFYFRTSIPDFPHMSFSNNMFISKHRNSPTIISSIFKSFKSF